MEYKNENVFVGNKIKSYRNKLKWTQEELARRLNVKNNTVSAYERGQISIPHAKLVEIAKVFEISYLDLLPIEGTDTNDTISEYIQEAKSQLDEDQLEFLEELISQTLSLNEEERKNFLKNIKVAVKVYNEN